MGCRSRSHCHDRAHPPASAFLRWRNDCRVQEFLEDLCSDFSSMGSSGQRIAVEGAEIELPTVTSRPLGFIANELITNAAKYGKGRVAVRLKQNLEVTPFRFPTMAEFYQKV